MTGRRDRIAIIGPGRMGLALGAALVQADAVERIDFFGRDEGPPPHPIFETGSGRIEYRGPLSRLPDATSAVILAVPDEKLVEVAYGLATFGPAPAGCVALHLAGAISTDVLAPLHAVGYEIGSMHPLQSVADPWSGGGRLAEAGFALAGQPGALAVGRRLVRALGGRPFVIPPTLRPLYHAAATYASNYLVALIAVAARLMQSAGVDQEDALPAMLHLVRGTLDNLEQLGPAAALTGPIARGDVDTVRLHLARLSDEDRALYCALGRETVRLARAAGLDPGRAVTLESLLAIE